MKARFVILSHGRTGSTALCDGLNNNPNICCAYELFGPANQKLPAFGVNSYESGDAASYLDNFYQQCLKPCIGFKIFTFHARNTDDQLKAWHYLVANEDIKCIFLSREDILASFVSEQRAKQSGKWHPSPTGDNGLLEGKIWVDPREAERYLYRVYAEMKWLEKQFGAHQILHLDYEDLNRDFESALADASFFLGVDYVSSSVRFKPLMGSSYHEIVENIGELREHIKKTVFHHLIEDLT